MKTKLTVWFENALFDLHVLSQCLGSAMLSYNKEMNKKNMLVNKVCVSIFQNVPLWYKIVAGMEQLREEINCKISAAGDQMLK